VRTGLTVLYARIVGVFLLVQGVVTGTFLLIDPLDNAFPVLLDTTRMVPQHSALHVLTGLLALAVLSRGGARELWWFALGFGLFYTALAVSGLVTFDHSIHLLAGIPGLLAAGLGQSGPPLKLAGGPGDPSGP
jgi:hypothetical protein